MSKHLEDELEEHKEAIRFLELMLDAKANPTTIYLLETLESKWQTRLEEFFGGYIPTTKVRLHVTSDIYSENWHIDESPGHYKHPSCKGGIYYKLDPVIQQLDAELVNVDFYHPPLDLTPDYETRITGDTNEDGYLPCVARWYTLLPSDKKL
jgi:hypothetical protein